jgi:hypothetical protein
VITEKKKKRKRRHQPPLLQPKGNGINTCIDVAAKLDTACAGYVDEDMR